MPRVTDLPILNPYYSYIKPKNRLSTTIKSLIPSKQPQVKEYVQASSFDQHPLFATQKEQLVPISIPDHLPPLWLKEKFTHIHFGYVRLALTFHARKGLATTARIALLDTRFSDYQQACIGTVETTLNAGTVLITLFPNFNMALPDPRFLFALKVQL